MNTTDSRRLLGAMAVGGMLMFPSMASAAFVQLFSETELSGPITTLNFEDGSVSGPGVSFEPGSWIVSTGYSAMHSGTRGLAEPGPFTSGPDNLAIFSSGVYQVGLYFGNDDTCCTTGFVATLRAYDAADALIGAVSVTANMNDAADQFLGIWTDTPIFKTVLDYGIASSALWGVIDDFSYGGVALGISSVPEPSALAILAAGLAGLGFRLRKPADAGAHRSRS